MPGYDEYLAAMRARQGGQIAGDIITRAPDHGGQQVPWYGPGEHPSGAWGGPTGWDPNPPRPYTAPREMDPYGGQIPGLFSVQSGGGGLHPQGDRNSARRGMTPHVQPHFSAQLGGGGRVIGDPLRTAGINQRSAVDHAGINAYYSASPAQRAAYDRQGITPNYMGVSVTGPSGAQYGRTGGVNPQTIGGQPMGGPGGIGGSATRGVSAQGSNFPNQDPNQQTAGQNLLAQFQGLLGGYELPDTTVYGSTPSRNPIGMNIGLNPTAGSAPGEGAKTDVLIRNDLIRRNNQEAATRAAAIRQRGLLGGLDPSAIERRIIESDAMHEQSRRSSLAENQRADNVDRRADIELALQERGINIELLRALAEAFSRTGGGF